LETGLFYLDFPTFLHESACVATKRGEPIIDHVTSNAIALTYFSARLNLSDGPGESGLSHLINIAAYLHNPRMSNTEQRGINAAVVAVCIAPTR